MPSAAGAYEVRWQAARMGCQAVCDMFVMSVGSSGRITMRRVIFDTLGRKIVIVILLRQGQGVYRRLGRHGVVCSGHVVRLHIPCI